MWRDPFRQRSVSQGYEGLRSLDVVDLVAVQQDDLVACRDNSPYRLIGITLYYI